MRYAVVTFLAALSVSSGVAFADTGETPASPAPAPYERICESAGLRSMERADCRAQMKAAGTDAERRAVYRVFDVRMNGAMAAHPPAPASTDERPSG